jgi:hypothetical protein
MSNKLKPTANQRRAQAHAAGQNIQREAHRIAAEKDCDLSAALADVFSDRTLLAKCHDVPPLASFPSKWTEPETK